ncbi:DUF3533 domain-containing protein [Streptomyces scabiei]|uniref:DUF3533 domain-containing protein n=1 Tax=Streptomyces scabiei TaxID=1930 RepID=UPI0038F80238
MQTLAIGSTPMAALSPVMGTLVIAGAVGIMGMDASHLPLLWLYSVCVIAVAGIGALALLAVFGTPGMLVVTLVFIGMAVPTAGATTPIEALPGFYRFLAEFEPLRRDHRRNPLDPLLRRPGRRGADPRLGHDGGRSRRGGAVRLRRAGVVRPQGPAVHPGEIDVREDGGPGVAEAAHRAVPTPGTRKPIGFVSFLPGLTSRYDH